jgi:type II secretory pathway pseudopilin PulG
VSGVNRRTGVILLEVMVALVILSVAGMTAVVLAAESSRAVAHAREADGAMRAASAFLDAVALWPRADLDRHLGDRPQGRWRMRVDRPVSALYVVTLRDGTTGAEVLTTSLYRPAPPSSAP